MAHQTLERKKPSVSLPSTQITLAHNASSLRTPAETKTLDASPTPMETTQAALPSASIEAGMGHDFSLLSVLAPSAQRLAVPPNSGVPDGEVTTDVEPIVQRGLAGGGSSLDGDTQSFMETRFGHDFSQVKVHTDGAASESAQSVAARAYTVGSDIAFSSGEYSPGSSGGRELLAHELTHVVQQGGAMQMHQPAKAPIVQRCAACEAEEANLQRTPIAGTSSQHVIQRWPFSDDDDQAEKKEPDSNSGGGVLGWIEDKGSAAIDWAKDKGSDAVDYAKDKGSDAVDWAKDKGSDAVDWAKDKGSGAVDWVKDKGGAVVNAVEQEGSSVLLEAQKSLASTKLNAALQQLGSYETVYFTDDQLSTLNGHIADLRTKSQGLISPSDISPQSEGADTASGATPVSASSVQALLSNLQSSVSAQFMSPSQGLNITDSGDSATVQGSLQRNPAAVAVVAGLSIAEALAVLAIILIVALLVYAAIILISQKLKEREEEQEQEQADKEAKEKEATRLKKITECLALYAVVEAAKNCPKCKGTDTKAERAVKIACFTALIAARAAYLEADCDDYLQGSIDRKSRGEDPEAGHKQQLEIQQGALQKCFDKPTVD